MTEQVHALQSSVERLRGIVESLDIDSLTQPAYPSDWTIADTLSHLGSGAVIMASTLEAAISGEPVGDGFNQSVWDEWNAKSPGDQAADLVLADRNFLEQVDALTDDQRASVQFPFGPMTLDLAGALGMRLNEHALHTWDVEVVGDSAAVLPAESAAVVLASLPMIIGFGGKDDGVVRRLTIRTSDPTAAFVLTSGAGSVGLTPGAGDGPSVDLPAESLVRLVYGRLDPEHTPDGLDGEAIAELRQLFPGF